MIFENYPTTPCSIFEEIEAFEKTNLALGIASEMIESQLKMAFVYDTNHFSDSSVTQIIEGFESILQGIYGLE